MLISSLYNFNFLDKELDNGTDDKSVLILSLYDSDFLDEELDNKKDNKYFIYL